MRRTNKNSYKQGFTLVELLAVIVILAIILVIAVPQIMNVIEKSKKGTIESTLKMIASSAEKEYMKRLTLGALDQENNPIGCTDVVKLSSKDYESCKITFDSNSKVVVTLTGNGKFENYICENNTCIIRETTIYSEDILHGAYPRLSEGMIPVTISDTGVVTSADPESEWYSYAEKEWANVVLVKDDVEGKREGYKVPNTIIPESDIYAYLVWIPRYRYKLFNVDGNIAVYNESGECTSNCPVEIDITFESTSTAKSNGTTNGTYLTHPAFTYDNRELNGIWVGKFETTGDATTPEIKPNVSPKANQNVSTQFKISLKFGMDTRYGLSVESRMSKNSDWGAIVYLSHSDYGIEDEIRINNYRNGVYQLTGCGASTRNEGLSTTCGILYGASTVNGVFPQSTTGNIYGVFDMSGGSGEYQMSVLEDSSGNAISGLCNIYNSGYKGLYGNKSYTGCDGRTEANTTGLGLPNNRYYQSYNNNTTNWQSNINYLGEALGETRGWYQDTSHFAYGSAAWIVRGGDYSNGTSAGGFNTYSYSGGAGSYVSFRVVVS